MKKVIDTTDGRIVVTTVVDYCTGESFFEFYQYGEDELFGDYLCDGCFVDTHKDINDYSDEELEEIYYQAVKDTKIISLY